MKNDLLALIWPALVGVLAATLILDKWVLDPPNSADVMSQIGYRDAVGLATPSVVNIYTAKLVETRRDPRLNSPILRRFRSNQDSTQRI